jgi:hypothetical protein
MNCINCGTEAGGKFCPNCGQRLTVRRITFKEWWTELWLLLSGFDGLFLRTLRELTVRPGFVARQYILGNRVRTYGPVSYFFLMITLFLLLMTMMNIDMLDFINERKEMLTPYAIKSGSGQERFMKLVIDFVSRNMKVIAFLNVPFHAFAARYLMFRKSGLNFMENMVMPFYLMGHLYWLSIVTVFVYFYTNSYLFATAVGILSVLYYGYGYATLIDYQPKWKSFLKGIGVYVGGQITLMVVAGIIAVIVIVILAYTRPDMLEMIRPSNNR